ncbi:secreted protein [Rhodopirellula maiorica SM1]|uniref:Secreted protein n=1 Tax=Rhodopirellula maiorica SM1 TaxID=1265738 RepID=M5R7U3_9BACT|nr:hypothetical protein [Rhodopirellula maiorica]EMI15455.1 secreted protein [Rhodopirellula maiorica SM1]
MQTQFLRVFLLCFPLSLSLVAATGCDQSTGGLATDSGEMTLEEYERIQAEEQEMLNATMPSEMKK